MLLIVDRALGPSNPTRLWLEGDQVCHRGQQTLRTQLNKPPWHRITGCILAAGRDGVTPTCVMMVLEICHRVAGPIAAFFG